MTTDLSQSIQDVYYDWIKPTLNWFSYPTVETIPIYHSIKTRLDDLNFHLNQTEQELRTVSSEYDNAKNDTTDKEAIYNACDKKVKECLSNIKDTILHFCEEVENVKAEINNQEEELILESMNKLVSSISKLKKPNDLGEWLDTSEYCNLLDYHLAVRRRDDAKEEVERYKRNEKPFKYRLDDVKEKMSKIEKERDTLSEFSSKYKEGYVQLSQRDPPPPYEDDSNIIVSENLPLPVPAPTFIQPPTAYNSVYGITKHESAS